MQWRHWEEGGREGRTAPGNTLQRWHLNWINFVSEFRKYTRETMSEGGSGDEAHQSAEDDDYKKGRRF